MTAPRQREPMSPDPETDDIIRRLAGTDFAYQPSMSEMSPDYVPQARWAHGDDSRSMQPGDKGDIPGPTILEPPVMPRLELAAPRRPSLGMPPLRNTSAIDRLDAETGAVPGGNAPGPASTAPTAPAVAPAPARPIPGKHLGGPAPTQAPEEDHSVRNALLAASPAALSAVANLIMALTKRHPNTRTMQNVAASGIRGTETVMAALERRRAEARQAQQDEMERSLRAAQVRRSDAETRLIEEGKLPATVAGIGVAARKVGAQEQTAEAATRNAQTAAERQDIETARNDPESRGSEEAREALRSYSRATGANIDPAAFEGRSQRSLEEDRFLGPMLREYADTQARRAAAASAGSGHGGQDLTDEQRALVETNTRSIMAAHPYMDAEDAARSARALTYGSARERHAAQSLLSQAAVSDRASDARIERYVVRERGLRGLQSSLTALKAALASVPEEAVTMMLLERDIPPALRSSQLNDLRTLYQRFVNDVGHNRFGSALTETEVGNLSKEMADTRFGSGRALITVVNRAARIGGLELADLQASLRDRELEEATRRTVAGGGSVPMEDRPAHREAERRGAAAGAGAAHSRATPGAATGKILLSNGWRYDDTPRNRAAARANGLTFTVEPPQ